MVVVALFCAAGAAVVRPSATGTLPKKAVAKALLNALKDAAARVGALLALEPLAGPQLLERLAAKDERVRTMVVRRLTRVKGDAVSRALINALRDRSMAVRLAAVGALAQRKDRAAVPGLIALAAKQSRAVTTQIQYALAAIGGEKAEAFLLVMSSGHRDPVVQRRAAEALAELRRHRAAKPTDRSNR